MPGAAVATDKTGDVEASPSGGPPAFPFPTGAVAGTWQAGPVSTTPYAHFKLAGAHVIWQATCTFTLTGATDSNGAAITPIPTSLVTLTAPATTLQAGATNVLRRGHSANDEYGNKLEAKPSGILTTT
jgi:hypothetical protein